MTVRSTPSVFLALLLTLGAILPGTASAELPPYDGAGRPLPSLAPMLEGAVPAVVNVFTRTRVPVQQHPLLSDPIFRRFFEVPEAPPERYAQSLGSGVVVDAKHGYIITNHHVIDHAVQIAVNLMDGRTLQAELVGSDPEADIAVIKVPPEKLTAIPMADSGALRVGDFVVAVGNPFGLGQTVTSGIVSALGRSGLGIEGYEDFIQTDASINPGNSGGALVNLRGELVGINTAILSRSGGNIGIGFAIPINMARDIMTQIVKHGEVRRGRLGAQAQDLTPDLAAAFGIKDRHGAVVTQVEKGSPADKSGLKAGDIITHINGRPVTGSAEVRNRLGLLRVGERVELGVLRDGKSLSVHAELAEPKLVTLHGERLHQRLAGALLANIVEGSPLYGKLEGVLVAKVARGSPAWGAGLRKGDVIGQANRLPVANLDDLRKAVKGSRTLLLNIQRRGGALFIILQ